MRRIVTFLLIVILTVCARTVHAADEFMIDYPRNLSEQVVSPTADAAVMLRYQDCPVSYVFIPNQIVCFMTAHINRGISML